MVRWGRQEIKRLRYAVYQVEFNRLRLHGSQTVADLTKLGLVLVRRHLRPSHDQTNDKDL